MTQNGSERIRTAWISAILRPCRARIMPQPLWFASVLPPVLLLVLSVEQSPAAQGYLKVTSAPCLLPISTNVSTRFLCDLRCAFLVSSSFTAESSCRSSHNPPTTSLSLNSSGPDRPGNKDGVLVSKCVDKIFTGPHLEVAILGFELFL